MLQLPLLQPPRPLQVKGRGVSLLPQAAGISWGLHSRPSCAASQVAVLCIFFAVVFALYLAPLTVSSPCIMEKKDLGPKPSLIGHRGAPMVSALLERGPRTRSSGRAAPSGNSTVGLVPRPDEEMGGIKFPGGQAPGFKGFRPRETVEGAGVGLACADASSLPSTRTVSAPEHFRARSRS